MSAQPDLKSEVAEALGVDPDEIEIYRPSEMRLHAPFGGGVDSAWFKVLKHGASLYLAIEDESDAESIARVQVQRLIEMAPDDWLPDEVPDEWIDAKRLREALWDGLYENNYENLEEMLRYEPERASEVVREIKDVENLFGGSTKRAIAAFPDRSRPGRIRVILASGEEESLSPSDAVRAMTGIPVSHAMALIAEMLTAGRHFASTVWWDEDAGDRIARTMTDEDLRDPVEYLGQNGMDIVGEAISAAALDLETPAADIVKRDGWLKFLSADGRATTLPESGLLLVKAAEGVL